MRFVFGLLFLFSIFAGSVRSAASRSSVSETEPAVYESLVDGRDLYWYIDGLSGNIVDIQAQAGLEKCDPVTWETVSSSSNCRLETYILLDNSVSIREENREKIRLLLRQLINQHMEGEKFRLDLYSSTVNRLTDFTDQYETILDLLDAVPYENQDSCLNDILFEILEDYKRNPDMDRCLRIILISDGTDDSISGFGDEELGDFLESAGCPVTVIGSYWNGDPMGQARLKMISYRSGGQYYSLDTSVDPAEEADFLRMRENLYRIRIPLPYQCMDGRENSILVKITTEKDAVVLRRQEFLPVFDIDLMERSELQESETETETAQEVYTETETETFRETETEIEKETDKVSVVPQKKFRIRSVVFVLSGVLIVCVAAGVIIVISKKRHFEKEPELDVTDEVYHSDLEFINKGSETEKAETAGSEETILMWNESKKRELILRDVSCREKFYRIQISDEIVIGRNPDRCQLVIPNDNSISSRHIRFLAEGHEITAEDMDSSNGSIINGMPLTGKVPLHDGDTIKIGRTELIIEFC